MSWSCFPLIELLEEGFRESFGNWMKDVRSGGLVSCLLLTHLLLPQHSYRCSTGAKAVATCSRYSLKNLSPRCCSNLAAFAKVVPLSSGAQPDQ